MMDQNMMKRKKHMVNINIDAAKYEYTTKNIYNLEFEEKIVDTKDVDLKFYFAWKVPWEVPCLLVGDKEYQFESMGGMIFFLQKLSLNSTLIASLSNETLVSVVNERLQDFSSILNLVVNSNTDQILTVTSMSAKLVSWKKIIQAINEVFITLEEKTLYCTTHTGLGISIVMSDANTDLDVIRIEPQSASNISIYRGVAREEVPLRGYDEDEIMVILKEKLQLMLNIDPSISKNYSLVRD